MNRLERGRAAALAASKASQAKAKRENAKIRHTPGPWVARRLEKEGFCYEDVMDEYGYYIATCHEGVRCESNAGANARLIAAAPDLLASLQRIVAVLDKQVASPHLAERASPLAQAKAAISKATGETA